MIFLSKNKQHSKPISSYIIY